MSSSQQQQHKRVAEDQNGEHSNIAKRSRALADGEIQVKQEGEGAMVPMEAMEEPKINFRLTVSRLHCQQCVLPLKPPTFKCKAGHVVCCSCRSNHAKACAGAGTYVPCTALDGITNDVEVPCTYEAYGCTSWVVYYKEMDHSHSCRFKPCFCPVPGCGLSTSPARLADHFSLDHGWPVTEFDYGKPYKLAVLGPEDKMVLVAKADGSVFLMSPCAALGASMAVSLVCVRACGDVAVKAPQYHCKLWAQVPDNKDNLALATFMVHSSNLAGGFAPTDQGMFLTVPPALLHDESAEPALLMVRIDKVGMAAAGAMSGSPSATPPSNLPAMRIGN